MFINTDDYIDSTLAAELLGVTRETITRHCQANRFPGQIQIGRFWLIPREAVENFTRLKPGPKKKGSVKSHAENDN